jgi:hypothetical protein
MSLDEAAQAIVPRRCKWRKKGHRAPGDGLVVARKQQTAWDQWIAISVSPSN